MKRSGPIERKTPLTSSTPLPRSGLGRNAGPKLPAKPKRRKDTGPSAAVRRLVAARSGGMCEAAACWQAATELHHRRPRRMGGSSDPTTNLPANLLDLCRGHHSRAESNRTEALAWGLLLHANQDPIHVPVVSRHGRVWLRHDGTTSDTAPPIFPTA